MRFPRAFGSKFNDIIVSFAVWNKPDKLQQLTSFPEHLRVETDTLHEQVNPFIGRKFLAGLNVSIIVEMGELDRLDGLHYPRTGPSVIQVLIFQFSDAPNPADQQFGMFFNCIRGYQDFFNSKVGKGSFIGSCIIV
jgi:hypothetical protein